MAMTSEATDGAPPPRTFLQSAWLCCLYGTGIIGSLVVYGLLQERIMAEPYGTDMFKVSAFLVWCNRMVAVVFALVMIAVKGESFVWVAPLWKYLAISLSNVGATWCQYEALMYVSFPVQMLGKSFKMMPVMFWGIAIAGKHYGASDWLVAAAVTGGVTEFLMTGSIAAKNSSGDSMYGLVLLGVFLALDGFTSTFQEKLFKDHNTSKYNQMLYVNSCSALVSFSTLVVANQVSTVFAFCTEHPLLLSDAGLLSAAAVTGQYFIYSQVKEFGALVFAATMNARQIISILISFVTYHHPINGLQILGLFLVFGGLFYKSWAGFSAHQNKLDEKLPLLDQVKDAPQVGSDENQKTI